VLFTCYERNGKAGFGSDHIQCTRNRLVLQRNKFVMSLNFNMPCPVLTYSL
jgi:hypothetical protein